MTNNQKICLLLDDIMTELLDFEKETMEITECDIDEVLAHTENRVTITEKIDVIYKQIDEICSIMEDGSEIRRIIRNVSDFSSVDEKHTDIYLKAQGLFSVLSRIRDSDVQAVSRINLEKNMLLKKIKETNNGREAKASRFIVGTDDLANKKHFDNNGTSI